MLLIVYGWNRGEMMVLENISASYKFKIVAIASVMTLLCVPIASDARNKVGQMIGSASGLSHPTPGERADGNVFVDKWAAASRQFQDYTYDFQMTVQKSASEKVNEKGILWFKQPHMIRIEVTGGPKAGSVAVFLKDGNVKAHMGGAMKFLTVSLAPDSSFLRSANGWPMSKSDFLSLADAVKGYIKDGCSGKVSASPVTVDGYPTKVYDWSLYKANGVIYKRALFDANTMQPVEWWDYVDGKEYAHSLWTNFRSNIGLSDKTFTIKGDK